MKVLILDYQGMVGHVIYYYFKEHGHDVDGFDGDIHDVCEIIQRLQYGDYDAIINTYAIINQFAEEDKAEAVYVNAYLPHLLEKLTSGTKTILVHRSTDCVFSGSKGSYGLEDKPDGESFYARTKAIGEVINDKDICIRTSLVGPEQKIEGISLLNWFLRQDGDVNGFANAIWTGLTTDEFARVIEHLLIHKAHGLFHTVPKYGISKYQLLEYFNKYFVGNRNIVRIDNDLVDKSLKQEVGDFQLELNDYETQIRNMAQWVKDHQELYPEYYRSN